MAATANSIITPQTVVSGTAVCTTANTGYGDSPTNTVLLIPAATNGQRITKVFGLARATVTATELQLFASSDGGTTKRLIASKLMPAYTVAQTTGQPPADFGYSDVAPLELAPGESVYAAIGVSNTGIVLRYEGGAY